MNKYKVSYLHPAAPEIFEAQNYFLETGWFVFQDPLGQVVRIRENTVDRIDKLGK